MTENDIGIHDNRNNDSSSNYTETIIFEADVEMDNNNGTMPPTIEIMPVAAAAATTAATTTLETSEQRSINKGYDLTWCRIEKTVQVKTDKRSQSTISTTGRTSSVFLSKSFRASTPTTSPAGTTTTTIPTTTAIASTVNALQQQQPKQDQSAATTKDILKGISGSAGPGEVLALMGPSGSGKTSLLNVLSGRSSYQNGTICINGQIVTKKRQNMKRLMSQVAYVKQADIFFEHLTIRDQFTYTALLRLPDTMSVHDKLLKVDTIIEQLRLQGVAQSPIKLCSGGEKKRVNIGSEILTDPAVIMLDEPTSGLDSSSAVSLIRLLSSFAKDYGKTVITSIHQPSSAVFRSFDKLIMLSQGHVVYFGTPIDSIIYLKQQNLACPDGYNAADHWMDVLVHESSIDYNNNTVVPATTTTTTDNNIEINDEENAVNESSFLTVTPLSARQRLESAWDDNKIAKQFESQIPALLSINDSAHSSVPNQQQQQQNDANTNNGQKQTSKYNTSWRTQYYILTHRAFKNSRSAIFTPLNLTKSVALGFVAGLLWFQRSYTEANVNDIRSYYFFTMTFWVFDAMFNSLTAFPTERTVILKERSSASYRLSAYFMAKTTADAPVRVILPLLYMIISFWMAGMSNSFRTFIGSIGCTLLSVLAGEAIGLFIGAAVYDLQKGITIMTVFTLFLMLLGGFFVQNVPPFLVWAKYISPFKYAFDSSLQLVFTKPIPCDGSNELQELCAGGIGTYVSVDDILNSMRVQGSVAFNVGLLLVLIFIPRYLAYWALRSKKEGER